MNEPQDVLTVSVDRALTATVGGTDPEIFQNQLAQADINWSSLLRWLKTSMVKKIDYGTIPGVSDKPSLFKPGAEKICGRLGWRRHFPGAEKYENASASGIALVDVTLRCQLFNAAGVLIGEGLGSFPAVQKQRQWEGKGDDRRMVGYVDVYDANKALKMSEKRAMVDAVLSTAGLSAVFTQDIPDEGQDTTPLAERPAEFKFLEAKAQEVFGDGWLAALQSYALKVERISDGDYGKIPAFRLPYIITRLDAKAQEAAA